ncbi:anti-sigma factor family protein [Geodermatophilus ruber]|uniref:Putative zinc-finger n=1 Tax=Geodermatophilus ruber TaxID=504800 RepID=A0A1I4LSE9_9ACTN|nr:anti-sigma factor [Geodermatophilus ruber]SFL93855.1 Putative zinc-finger [Geodermatophilus ruber]
MNLPESHLAQEAIAALVDGELPSGPAGRAARHLAGCAQCRMAVEAQREAKEALHSCHDVAVPGDLLSRLQAIPFTTDVPGSGPGTLSAGPGQLTLRDASGAWSVPLDPQRDRPERHGRWLRRGVAGALAGLGLGVTALALSLPAPAADQERPPPASVAGSFPGERSEIVPPIVRTLTAHGDTQARNAGAAGGTP